MAGTDAIAALLAGSGNILQREEYVTPSHSQHNSQHGSVNSEVSLDHKSAAVYTPLSDVDPSIKPPTGAVTSSNGHAANGNGSHANGNAGAAAVNGLDPNAPVSAACGLGCRQLRAMMYKNWLNKYRNPCQLACELFTPILMMFILVIGYNFSLHQETNVPTTYYSNDTSLLQQIINQFENDIYPIPPSELSMPPADLMFAAGDALPAREIERDYKVVHLPPLTPGSKLADALTKLFPPPPPPQQTAPSTPAAADIPSVDPNKHPPRNATCYRIGYGPFQLPYEICPKQHDITSVLSFIVNFNGPLAVPTFDEYVGTHDLLVGILENTTGLPLNQINTYSDNRLGNLIYLGSLSFAPDTPSVRQLVDYLNLTNLLFDSVYGGTFKTADDAVNDALQTNSRFDQSWGVIVFDSLPDWSAPFSGANSVVDYTIRMNYSALPSTKALITKFNLGLDSSHKRYIYSGFSTLQQLIDVGIIGLTVAVGSGVAPTSISRAALDGSGVPPGFIVPPSGEIWTANFPIAAYTGNAFFAAVGPIMGLLMTMSMLYPVSRLIKGIVEEKETRTKETMKMMGLFDWVFVSSWFLTAFIELTAMAAGVTGILCSSVLQLADPSLVFIYFWLFFSSLITFSFFVSVFFSKAKLSGIVGPILMFATVIPRYAFFTATSGDMSGKDAVSILSATAFSFGCDLLYGYEGANLQLSWVNLYDDEYSLGRSMGFIFLDFFLYAGLAFYFEHTLPNEYGQRKPFYFLCTRNYWCGSKTQLDNTEQFGEAETGEHVEPVRRSGVRTPVPSVRIRNLRRVFVDGSGVSRRETVAVHGLSIDMYENEIYSLLGHNGAGKTTTISMLTGLIEPSGGDAFINGASVRHQMSRVRTSLGICPQHNVLFEKLTVAEHLELYAALKGVPSDRRDAEVTAKINEVGLTSRRDYHSSALSGGMQRKLSVAIALIGGSKVVFLDEPTSGMDPHSRRSTWEILKRCKAGRTIILTTHFMDEADLLGDRIAIMAHGRLQCAGSSLFLKARSGIGYTLTLVKSEAKASVKEVDALIGQFVPERTVLSTAGGEMSFRLPLHSVPQFASLFAAIERDRESLFIGGFGISMTTLEEVFMRLSLSPATAAVPTAIAANSALAGTATSASLAGVGQFSNFFDDVNAPPGSSHQSITSVSSPMPPGTGEADLKLEVVHNGNGFEPPANGNGKGVDKQPLLAMKDVAGDSSSGNGGSVKRIVREEASFGLQFTELFRKRVLCAMRDLKGRFFEIILPVVTVALVLLILKLNINPAGPSILLNSELYNFPSTLSGDVRSGISVAPTPYSAASFERLEPHVLRLLEQRPALQMQPTGATTSMDISLDLLATAMTHDGNRYSALVMNDTFTWPMSVTVGPFTEAYDIVVHPLLTILQNSSFYHTLPLMTAEINAARFRVLLQYLANSTTPPGDASYSVRNYPLPLTQSETVREQTFLSFFVSIFVLIPFSYLPGSFVIFVVKERASKAKHLQLVSGVNPTAYWLSTYAWDCVNYTFVCLCCMAVFAMYNNHSFTGTSEHAGGTLLLLLLYGFSVLPLSYIYSFVFENHTSAQVGIAGLHFVFGFVLVMASFILDAVESTHDTNQVLKHLYRCFPPFNLGEGLIAISEADFFAGINHNNPSIFAWDTLGRNLSYLGGETLVFCLLTLVIEYDTCRLSAVKARIENLLCGASTPSAAANREAAAAEDVDVAAERTRIEKIDVVPHGNGVAAAAGGADTIVLRDLRKVYPARSGGPATIAVADLSLGIPRGECFGLLGVNGAGKTTTLKMLTGDEQITSGDATINGYDVRTQMQDVRREVGYCPQFDPLLDLMTGRESLTMYARLRGIPEANVTRTVNGLLQTLGLHAFSDRIAGSYSGGTKRKLSLGLALIGNPSTVFLDEPSTGMDPVSRRFMWDVISAIAQHRSVVLTTHLMAECEALCTRIGIMVGGRLRCLGTVQHLKSRFGAGYQMEIKVRTTPPPAASTAAAATPPSPVFASAAEQSVKQFVSRQFPDSILEEEHNSKLKYRLPDPKLSLSAVFGAIETAKSNGAVPIEEYALSQSTLEQTFILMAKADNNGNPLPAASDD